MYGTNAFLRRMYGLLTAATVLTLNGFAAAATEGAGTPAATAASDTAPELSAAILLAGGLALAMVRRGCRKRRS